MLDICRERAEKEGFISRCTFHEGYVESLPDVELHAANVPTGAIEKTHSAWAKDVAILPPYEVKSIIESGGFDSPVQFYQAGFVHVWFSRNSPVNAV